MRQEGHILYTDRFSHLEMAYIQSCHMLNFTNCDVFRSLKIFFLANSVDPDDIMKPITSKHYTNELIILVPFFF